MKTVLAAFLVGVVIVGLIPVAPAAAFGPADCSLYKVGEGLSFDPNGGSEIRYPSGSTTTQSTWGGLGQPRNLICRDGRWEDHYYLLPTLPAPPRFTERGSGTVSASPNVDLATDVASWAEAGTGVTVATSAFLLTTVAVCPADAPLVAILYLLMAGGGLMTADGLARVAQ